MLFIRNCKRMGAALVTTGLMSFAASLKEPVRIGEILFQAEEIEGSERPLLKGTLAVFENNLANKGRKIDLAITVLPALRSDEAADPLFYIAGGPGTAASAYIGNFILPVFAEIRQTRTIVVIDQRGTGDSNPLKGETTHYRAVRDYLTPTIDVALVRASRDHYRERGDLQYYNSLNAVFDLEAVRRAMGYERINFYATSYGVRPALIYIQKFPDRVRAAILKGIAGPDAVIPVSFAKDAQGALERLASKCAGDPACARAYPQFRCEFDAVMAQLSAAPQTVRLTHPESGEIQTAALTRQVSAHLVRSCLMDTALAARLPYLIHRAHQGDYQPLAELALRIKQAYLQLMYEGMSLCVICREDYPRFIGTDFEDETDGTFMGRAWVDPAVEGCRILGLDGFSAPDYLRLSPQTTAVLLISGGFDGATPPHHGEALLKYFPNGRHLVVANGAHSFRGMTGCVEGIMAQFINAGSTAALETGCVDAIPFPPFHIDE